MKILQLLVILWGISLTGFTQANNRFAPYQIGDQVSNIHFTNLVNSPKTSMNLSDLSGKLVILDFWASWCTACLGKFESLDELQQQYDGKLNFMLITRDSKKIASETLSRFKTKKGSRISLPSVTGDSMINNMFPHRLIPHYVWIMENKVVAITSSDEITISNINNILAGKPANMRMKNDLLNYDRTEAIFKADNMEENPPILFNCTISGYKSGIGGGSTIKKEGKNPTRLSVHNQTILQLYQFMLRKAYTKARIIIDIPDKEKVSITEKDSSNKYDKLYCFELATTPMPAEILMNKAKNALENYFGYTASIEKRNIPCLVLTNRQSMIADSIVSIKKSRNTVNGTQHLTELLELKLNIPVIDESSKKIIWDKDILPDLSDKAAVFEFLEKRGFSLKESKREIEVFVLSQK